MFLVENLIVDFIAEQTISRPSADANVIEFSAPNLGCFPGLLYLLTVLKDQTKFAPTTIDLEDAIWPFLTNVDFVAASEAERDAWIEEVRNFFRWASDSGYISAETHNALLVALNYQDLPEADE